MPRPVVPALPAYLRLLLGVMNIPTKVGAKAWEKCFRILAEHAELFGINEVGSPRAKRLYIRLKDELGFAQFGVGQGPNPVFWARDTFRFLRGRVIRLHGRGKGRLARRFPGFNGARFLTEVVLRHRESDQIVAVLNFHLVAPGWKVLARWRAEMRRKSLARIDGLVAFHLSKGRVVVLMGDTNIGGAIDLTGVTWLFVAGVDRIAIAVPKGVTLDDFDIAQLVAPTDHKHGRFADARLTVGAAS